MAVTYGFFNSVLVNGMQDRRYNADQMSTYFKGLISDGVYQNVGGGLQVRAGEGMTVQVMPGRGVFDSRWLENDSVLDIPLNSSHVTLNRYTAVVVRVDYNERTVSILAKDGETASAPVKPAMTRTESVKEYCLAYVYVGRGVTSISQSAVTDTRPDNALCGFVTGLVEQIQTTDLFAQYDAAFGEWFETIEDKLSGDVAGKLTVDVERLDREKQDKISGTQGQIVGFDANGEAVAQAPPDTGVTSFKGRKGAVAPQAGDYTAAQVGALPISGGTINGNIDVKGELTLYGKPLVGKSLAGKSVQPKQGTMVIADEGAEIFNDYRTRTFDTSGNALVGNIASSYYSHAEGELTTASGTSSHAEGTATIASGHYSHAEGRSTTASGSNSHAEGEYSVASGSHSHAEGDNTRAANLYTHAEGSNTAALGVDSHAEGKGCIAGAWYGGHAEGCGCLSLSKDFYDGISNYGSASPNSYFTLQNSYLLEKLTAGNLIIVVDQYYISGRNYVFTVSSVSMSNKRVYVKEALPDNNFSPVYLVLYEINNITDHASHAEGYRTMANGIAAHAEGKSTVASKNSSHSEGENTTASGTYSHAEGANSKAQGPAAHAEGLYTIAVNYGDHAEGDHTTASGNYSHAEGSDTIASGTSSHAEGVGSVASGEGSHAGGVGTKASASCQTAIGKYNIESTNTSDRLIIGKGTTTTARANCFRATDTGVYASGSYNASGADYAEFFEWLDGNPEKADRVGLFVTLAGEKIRLAQPDDDFILGIVSAEPSVCGDVYDDQWKGMYLYDIYGRPLWEDVEVPDETIEVPDPEQPDRTVTRVIIPAHTEHRQKLNPDFDNTQAYVPRSERPEWAAVGMLGKLVMRDDGTCRADGWCTVGENGTATYSGTRTKYRVMARLDESHIRVLIL